MTDVTDDFNRANGGLGANWTTSSDLATANSGNLQISSNAVVASPSAQFFASFYNASSFSNDQNAQAVISGSAGQGSGVVVRHQGTARSSFYAFFANVGGDAYYIRFDNGTSNILATLSGAGFNSGDTIKLRVVGNILTGSKNGVDYATQTDTTYTSGSPGVICYSGTIDSFVGGPIVIAAQTLTPNLVANDDTFNAPTAAGGAAVTLVPSLVVTDESFRVPAVVNVPILPPIEPSKDKRETILKRLLVLLQSVNSVTPPLNVFRNRAEIPTEKLPALVLLDGSEDLKYPDMPHTRGGAIVPAVFDLKPQVFIVLRPRDDINNVGIGEELSGLRMQVLKAFVQDDELRGLLGSNGEINYLGHQTDLQTGSTVLGQMQLKFQLSYVFDPNDLN